jgi:hypothetical protein
MVIFTDVDFDIPSQLQAASLTDLWNKIYTHLMRPLNTSFLLTGSWQLLWTSEASVHGLVRGQLLGAPVTDIFQDIDLQ